MLLLEKLGKLERLERDFWRTLYAAHVRRLD